MLGAFVLALRAAAQGQTWPPSCSSCYYVATSNVYDKAVGHCLSRPGGHVVTISSQKENEVVQQVCGQQMCWIGLEETEDTESWYWSDGARTAYRNWDVEHHQPNNDKGKDEGYAIMNSRKVRSFKG